EALGGLELGLVEVADAALAHQPGGLDGQPPALFAGAGFRVLHGVPHDRPSLLPRGCRQKISKASRWLAAVAASALRSSRATSSTLNSSFMAPGVPGCASLPVAGSISAVARPFGSGGSASGTPS